MDDDKIYLNYGDAQVELLAFLKAAADSVESYLSELPWSNKRKLLFRNAYSDLMTRGILGASNSTGNWKVQYGGDPVDLDSKSEKEKEMYGEAAYFIQQLMSGLASAKPLELLKKSNVPVFSNDEFNSQFELWIGRNMFGSQKDWAKLWVELDNNNNGIYDTSEREKILAKQLRSFGEYVSKNPDKFNFEGSAYDNLDDFLNRINTAATSLETKGYDRNDINALNLLGLNPSNYFYTGANRMVTLSNGTLMTLLEYNDLLLKQLSEQQAAIAQLQRDNQYKRYRFFGLKMNGKLPQTDDVYNYINGLATKEQLNGDEQSEIVGIFRTAARNNGLEDITDEELAKFGNKYLKGRLKKISGIEGFYWDTIGNMVVQPLIGNSVQPLESNSEFNLQDVINQNSPQAKEQEYLNSKIPGVTNAEWQELAAIGADIVSILDPEPYSAAVLGAGAAGLRHAAKNNTPGHKWTFWEGVGQGVDYLTGVIGAIPLFGDSALAAKVIYKGKKVLPIIQKGMRYAMRAGSWKDIYDGALSPEGRKTADKILNGEELTVQDWRNVGQIIRGLAGHHALNQSNRATKKVAEESGFQTGAYHKSNDNAVGNYLRKRGWIQSKLKTESSTPTLKLSKNMPDGSILNKEIKITPEQQVLLEKAFKEAKASERTAAAKRILGNEAIGDFEVVRGNGLTTTLRNYWRRTRKTGDSFGTEATSIPRGTDNFETWKNNRSWGSYFTYGTNNRLNTIARGLNSEYPIPTVAPNPDNPQPNPSPLPGRLEHINPRLFGLPPRTNLNSYYRNAVGLNEAYARRSSTRFINEGLNYQETFDYGNGQTLDIKIDDGKLTITDSQGNTLVSNKQLDKSNYSYDAKKQISKIIDSYRRTLMSNRTIRRLFSKEFIQSIKNMKKKGFLFKQGGTIDKQKIQKYKEFIKK